MVGDSDVSSKGGSVKEMNDRIAAMEKTRAALTDAPAPAAAPAAVIPQPDTITALRHWRLAASLRFVGKSLNVKGGK